ncbi:aspartyl/asparaginyl beta-hydroxylase domain-containing protein [Pyxidicoccus fallax]|uniref:Aspartyl/asparaginyl beta-hydroxylase domain-containing protein n=1 Tax=Pyxidicoccus fallax TaxID=394095 RepID=A0A848LLH6_9BACT|nr:aspartyl/asparaginyl beta-hydroxylase domain-containing protein [Pyxidicoccus fallax]NMO18464.1 aspartyl/asparaginyl beta-hydroxylase domain-containing protein [Pyxidicoccus fallax]NPC81675.1 aspartyl/asparaginyl beta-hydroxylase domain-containing protein [Pyxidicoccus fallax]
MSPVAIRLPRTYDAARMQAELRHLEALRRVSAGYAGEANHAWESLCLMAPRQGPLEGAGHRRPAGSPDEDAVPTEALARAPYLAGILEELPCPKRLVRLMSLGPGGIISEHRDEFVSFQDGLLRLHIPVVTHPDVDFFIDHQRCDWREGEFWYGDFSRPHSGHNRSQVTRVHLVMDVKVDDFVLSLFPAEFVAAQRALGIQMAGQEAPDEDPLRRFSFGFRLPAGFVPPGTSYEPLPEPADGRVQVQDGRLIVLVNEQPLLGLEPTSDDTLLVRGLAPGTTMECDFEQGRVVGAALVSGVDGARFRLQVRPG